MLVAEIVVVLAVVAGLAIAIAEIRKQSAERRVGVVRFGACTVDGTVLTIGPRAHEITSATHAEVLGAAQEARRSTVTRTAVGAVVGGVPGALVGHAAKKKTRSSNAVLTIDGDDWTESLPVSASGYREAVRFAQAINLAARAGKR
jgi:hypothetical protein